MNFIRRIPPFEFLLVTIILGIHLYAAFSDAYNFANTWFVRDDAYYYFKVAQNIAEGHGSTFDGINMTNGYHPLWLMICIPVFAFARFDIILPLRILLMVVAVFNAATAILVYRLVRNTLSHAVAMAAASFWAFNAYIHANVYKYGLETPLAGFAILLLLYKLSQFEKSWRTKPVSLRQVFTLAVLAAIVMFSRLDLVFLAAIAGIWIVFRGKPIRALLPLDAFLIFISMTSSVALRTGVSQYNSTYAASAVEAVILALLFKVITLYFLGAYQHPRTTSVLTTIHRTALGVTVGSIFTGGVYLLLLEVGIGKGFPRSAFLIDWGVSLLLLVVVRMTMYWFGNSEIKPGMQSTTPLDELKTNWKKWLTDGAAYYGVVGSLLGLYMLYNKIAFGTSSPVSGQVKRWWGTLIDTVYESPAPDWTSFFGISFHGAYDAWKPLSNLLLETAKKIYPLYPGSNTLNERYYMAMAALVLFTFVILLLNARRTRRAAADMALIPLAAGCGIQILSYTATAYGGVKEWYWISEMILLTLVGSLLLHLILRLPQKIKTVCLGVEFASLALSLFLAYGLGVAVISAMRHDYFPANRPYMEVLPYLEENTPPGAVIGMTGGGNVGYYIHDRTIVNMDGLINSYEYFRALQNREAPIYLRQHGMTIVFANPRLMGLPPYYGQFAPYFENYSQYGGKNLIYLLEEPKYQP